MPSLKESLVCPTGLLVTSRLLEIWCERERERGKKSQVARYSASMWLLYELLFRQYATHCSFGASIYFYLFIGTCGDRTESDQNRQTTLDSQRSGRSEESFHWDRCGPMSQECERFFVQEACFYVLRLPHLPVCCSGSRWNGTDLGSGSVKNIKDWLLTWSLCIALSLFMWPSCSTFLPTAHSSMSRGVRSQCGLLPWLKTKRFSKRLQQRMGSRAPPG